jgi:hypothetical protein
MKKLALSVLLSSFVMAAPALADDVDTMQQGLSMLELAAARVLRENQIDVDVTTLTLSQIGEIIGIMNDPHEDTDREALLVAIRRG